MNDPSYTCPAECFWRKSFNQGNYNYCKFVSRHKVMPTVFLQFSGKFTPALFPMIISCHLQKSHPFHSWPFFFYPSTFNRRKNGNQELTLSSSNHQIWTCTSSVVIILWKKTASLIQIKAFRHRSRSPPTLLSSGTFSFFVFNLFLY